MVILNCSSKYEQLMIIISDHMDNNPLNQRMFSNTILENYSNK